MDLPSKSEPMDVEIWIPSEISRISPLVDGLIQMIELSNCVPGEEVDVDLALREAVSNAVIHGNQMDARKRVYVRFRCEPEEGVSFVVRDQGRGFDPREHPDATSGDGIKSEHGRGILLMKFYMDEVSFEKGGTEVHMWKRATRKPRTVLPTTQFTAIPPTALPVPLPLSGGRRVRAAGKRGKRAEDHHHGDAKQRGDSLCRGAWSGHGSTN